MGRSMDFYNAGKNDKKEQPKPGNAWYSASEDQSNNYAGQIASGLWESTKNTARDIAADPAGALEARVVNAATDIGAAAVNTVANAWNSNPLLSRVKRAVGREDFKVPNVTAPDVIYNPRDAKDKLRFQGGSVDRDPAVGTSWSLGTYVPGDPLTTAGRVLDAASLIPAVKGVKAPRLKGKKAEPPTAEPPAAGPGKAAPPSGKPGGGTKIEPIKIPPTRPSADLSPLPPRGGFSPGGGPRAATSTLTQPKVQPGTKPIDYPEWKPGANPEYQIAPKPNMDTPDAVAPPVKLTPARVRFVTPTEDLEPTPETKPEGSTKEPTKVTAPAITKTKGGKNNRPKTQDPGAIDMSVGYQNVHPLTTW